MLGWTLSSIFMVQSHIWTSLLLLPSLAIRLWLLLPAQNQVLWPRERRRPSFDRYPHINLVPFILETTGRPGSHARKFINYLLRDADNPPIAVRGHLVHHPERSPKCHLQTTTYGCRYVNSWSLLSHPAASYILFLSLLVPATRFCTQPFSVSSTLQWCHVALLRLHLF